MPDICLSFYNILDCCFQAKTPVRDKPPKVPKESPSKSALKPGAEKDNKDDSSETKSDTPKSISPAPSGTPPARHTPVQGEDVSGKIIG